MCLVRIRKSPAKAEVKKSLWGFGRFSSMTWLGMGRAAWIPEEPGRLVGLVLVVWEAGACQAAAPVSVGMAMMVRRLMSTQKLPHGSLAMPGHGPG